MLKTIKTLTNKEVYIINNKLRVEGFTAFNIAYNDGFFYSSHLKDISQIPIYLKPLDDVEIPYFSEFQPTDNTIELSIDIIDYLEKTLKYHSKEAFRYYLQGAFLDFSNNSIISTDGHRLIKLNYNFNKTFKNVIISTEAVKALIALKKDFKNFNIKISETQLMAYNDSFSCVFNHIDGTYPDYNRVIPTAEALTPVDFVLSNKILKGFKFDKHAKIKFADNKIYFLDNVIADFNFNNHIATFNARYLLDIAPKQYLFAQENNNSPLKLIDTEGNITLLMPITR